MMTKQWWSGFLIATAILGHVHNWTGVFVSVFVYTVCFAIVVHIKLQNYEKRISDLLEVKARQKMHLRRFIDASDRLEQEGKIVLFTPLVSNELRKKVKKKKPNDV